MVKVIQLNLGGRKGCLDNLEIQLSQGNISIAILQEPCTYNGKIIGLSGGTVFYKEGSKKKSRRDRTNLNPSDIENTKPRACIWVSKEMMGTSSCLGITEFTTLDQSTVTLKFKNKEGSKTELLISSIYCPDNKPMISATMRDLITQMKLDNKNFILAGDFNAHHLNWGSKDINIRGDALMDWILANDLDIINHGGLPTRCRNWTNPLEPRTHIDLTISNSNITHKINNWFVDHNDSLSDHKAIKFSIESETNNASNFRNRRKTNFKGFHRDLSARAISSNEIANCIELDIAANELNNAIKQAFYRNCKIVKVKKKFRKPWMSKEIDRVRKHSKILWNRYLKKKSNGNMRKYKEVKDKLQKMIDEAKRDSWRDKMEEIEDIREISRLQKFFEKGRSRPITSVIKPDASYTKNMEETLEHLIRHHFPNCADIVEDDDEIYPDPTNFNQIDLTDIDETITYDKIEQVIDNFGAFKSPGEDDIFPALLQAGKDIIIPRLITLFKASIKLKYIPRKWRGTKVIFIPKPGKGNYSEPGAYRPISLMSFILKTLEKLIDMRIRTYNLITKPLDRSQHAYQPGKSTETALHEMFTILEEGIYEKKNITLATFIDFKGAFDNTDTQVMLEALERHKVEKWLIDWIKAMLENRDIKAMNDTAEKHFSPKCGCPQGACSSPLLWCLVVDDLIRTLKRNGFKVIAYADDLAILYSDKDMDKVFREMNRAMRILAVWCEKHKLVVNTDKTKVMCFTNKHEASVTLQPIFYQRKKLDYVEEFKYLGLYLDPKIKMNIHIKTVCSKALASLWSTRAMVKRNWGLQPERMLWIYNQIILPRITYGSLVWWYRTNATNTAALDKIQRFALLLVSGSMKATPTQALNTAFNILPLSIKIKNTALKSYNRLAATSMWLRSNYNKEHREIATISNSILRTHEYDLIRRENNNDRKFKVIIRERETWDDETKDLEAIRWYSDGSKRDGRTAAGIFCPDIKPHENSEGLTRNIRLNDDATIAQAELIAIDQCARYCNINRIRNKNIIIYSDSQAAIKALKKKTIQSRTVKRVNQNLNSTAAHNNVYLVWCPGHSGIKGNEIADTQANLGIGRPDIDIRTSNPVSLIKQKMDEFSHEEFVRHWEEVPDLRFSKIMMPEPDKKRAGELIKMRRRKLRVAMGVLTGFCCFNWFLKMINKSSTDRCRFCGVEEEKMEHILTDCPIIERERKRFTGYPYIDPGELFNIKTGIWIKFLTFIGLDKTFFRDN